MFLGFDGSDEISAFDAGVLDFGDFVVIEQHGDFMLFYYGWCSFVDDQINVIDINSSFFALFETLFDHVQLLVIFDFDSG